MLDLAVLLLLVLLLLLLQPGHLHLAGITAFFQTFQVSNVIQHAVSRLLSSSTTAACSISLSP